MANLAPLIRLRKHTVDQKQKVLSNFYRQAEVLEDEKQTALDTLARERAVLEEQTELGDAHALFGRFAEGIKKKVEALDRQLADLEKRIEIARTDLREAFSELKKIEITADNRAKEAKREADLKERKELDEIAIETYRRQQADDENA